MLPLSQNTDSSWTSSTNCWNKINIPSFLQRTTPIARSLCEGWTPHDLHILVTAPFCWRVSHSVTHKHERWIWFTLSYAMMKALLRLAAVRDKKEAGELTGDTVHFIASSSARFFMMQNGSIYRPILTRKWGWPLHQNYKCMLKHRYTFVPENKA